MSSLLNRSPSTTFLNYTITNLATGIKLNDLVKDEAAAFLPYVVPDGDRPEHVAYNYYDSQTYVWLVMLSNQIRDPYYEWPLTVKQFEDWMTKKYGTIATAQATTIHCEHKTKKITVSPDSLTVSNGVSSSDYDAIDAYTYWERINENRRHIKLINKVYVNEIESQIKDLLNGS